MPGAGRRGEGARRPRRWRVYARALAREQAPRRTAARRLDGRLGSAAEAPLLCGEPRRARAMPRRGLQADHGPPRPILAEAAGAAPCSSRPTAACHAQGAREAGGNLSSPPRAPARGGAARPGLERRALHGLRGRAVPKQDASDPPRTASGRTTTLLRCGRLYWQGTLAADRGPPEASGLGDRRLHPDDGWPAPRLAGANPAVGRRDPRVPGPARRRRAALRESWPAPPWPLPGTGKRSGRVTSSHRSDVNGWPP